MFYKLILTQKLIMKKIFGLFFIILFSISACKKSSSPNISTVTIKYEINLTSALKDTSTNALIKYTSADGTLQTATDFLPGNTSWTKTISISSTVRPFPIELKTAGISNNYIYLTAPGTVTTKITVDNSIRVYQNSTTVNGPGYYFDSFALKDTLR